MKSVLLSYKLLIKISKVREARNTSKSKDLRWTWSLKDSEDKEYEIRIKVISISDLEMLERIFTEKIVLTDERVENWSYQNHLRSCKRIREKGYCLKSKGIKVY